MTSPGRSVEELVQRAFQIIDAHGALELTELLHGPPRKVVHIGDVSIWVDDDSRETLRVWLGSKLACIVQFRNTGRAYVDIPLVTKALLVLRRSMVLDDLANA